MKFIKRQRHLECTPWLLLIATICQISWAATPVSGHITTNTNWTESGSPYQVSVNNFTVKSGVTLIIEEGVEVELLSYQSAMTVEEGASLLLESGAVISTVAALTGNYGAELIVLGDLSADSCSLKTIRLSVKATGTAGVTTCDIYLVLVEGYASISNSGVESTFRLFFGSSGSAYSNIFNGAVALVDGAVIAQPENWVFISNTYNDGRAFSLQGRLDQNATLSEIDGMSTFTLYDEYEVLLGGVLTIGSDTTLDHWSDNHDLVIKNGGLLIMEPGSELVSSSAASATLLVEGSFESDSASIERLNNLVIEDTGSVEVQNTSLGWLYNYGTARFDQSTLGTVSLRPGSDTVMNNSSVNRLELSLQASWAFAGNNIPDIPVKIRDDVEVDRVLSAIGSISEFQISAPIIIKNSAKLEIAPGVSILLSATRSSSENSKLTVEENATLILGEESYLGFLDVYGYDKDDGVHVSGNINISGAYYREYRTVFIRDWNGLDKRHFI